MLLSSALFIWLLSRQDWVTICQSLGKIPLWVIPILLMLYYAGMILNGFRWYMLLRAQKTEVPFSSILKIVFTGAFLSNFLPSTIGGDAVRVFGVQRLVHNWVLSTASIFVDRLMNAFAMIAFRPLSIVTFGPGLLNLFGAQWVSPPAAACALPARRLAWTEKAKRAWQPVQESLRLWWNRPLYLVSAFLLSGLSVFVVFIAVLWIARLLGIQVALHQVIGINVITYFLTLIPISFNGYGVREFAMASLYSRLGASTGQAAMLALITRFFMLVETLPGALWISQLMPGVAQAGEVDRQQEES